MLPSDGNRILNSWFSTQRGVFEMRKPPDSDEFVWKSAVRRASSRRAVTASVLAALFVAFGFVGGRLSTLIVPPTLTMQHPVRAPLPAQPYDASPRTMAEPASAPQHVEPAESPSRKPSPITIINAGNAPREPLRAGTVVSQAEQSASVVNSARTIPVQARNYTDLRRQMLSR